MTGGRGENDYKEYKLESVIYCGYKDQGRRKIVTKNVTSINSVFILQRRINHWHITKQKTPIPELLVFVSSELHLSIVFNFTNKTELYSSI